MLEKVFYTSVLVSDQDKALDFYTNVLGMEKRVENPTPDGPRFLTVGVNGDDFQLVLWPGTPGQAEPAMGRPPASITIESDDCRKTVEELKSRGVEFVSDVLEFPWGYVAQFQDPDGNRLQIREGRSQGPSASVAPGAAEIENSVAPARRRTARLGPPTVGIGSRRINTRDQGSKAVTRMAISSEQAPDALGPYSQAIVAGGLVFCSGMAGIDPETGAVAEGIEAQTEQALQNLAAVLSAAGSSMEDLVKTTIFYANVEDFGRLNEVYARHMPDPPPARSAPAHVRLPRGLLVSIEAIAVLPGPPTYRRRLLPPESQLSRPRSSPRARARLFDPAEAGGLGERRQRAVRQAARWVVLVVGARRHVVGRVGVKQSGEQLDLSAAHAQLTHATAVHRPTLARAARVDIEQRAQATDPRRLDVHHARSQRRGVDVLGGADRRVVGHPLELTGQPLRDLGQVVGVLQIGVRERGQHMVVQRPQRLGIFDLQAVVALEVDRVDRARRRDLVDERRRPRRLRIELEADTGGAGEPPAHRLDRRLLAETQRVDEPHRLGSNTEPNQ